ncbi:hypothetical protein E2542_SST25714 [Spatholobus suberectus]|nr:hypothetical protein E2542_SST25714 [Spatholobus suberectus]
MKEKSFRILPTTADNFLVVFFGGFCFVALSLLVFAPPFKISKTTFSLSITPREPNSSSASLSVVFSGHLILPPTEPPQSSQSIPKRHHLPSSAPLFNLCRNPPIRFRSTSYRKGRWDKGARVDNIRTLAMIVVGGVRGNWLIFPPNPEVLIGPGLFVVNRRQCYLVQGSHDGIVDLSFLARKELQGWTHDCAAAPWHCQVMLAIGMAMVWGFWLLLLLFEPTLSSYPLLV